MVKVYGCSDDLVEIEGSKYPDNEIGCFGGSDVQIEFEDGTVIQIHYGKENDSLGIWAITVLNKGTAFQELILCDDEYAKIYSDIFLIGSEVKRYEVMEE